jgi:hypothetical protein
MNKIYILSVFLLLGTLGFSQQTTNDWKLYPSKDSIIVDTLATDSTTVQIPADTIFNLEVSNTPGNIKINKDARINVISKELGTPTDGTTVKIKGYRVQLVASSKKASINEERAKFIALNPDVNTYSLYTQPNYKLRVGDFKTKLEAQKLQNEIKVTFPSALVVNDLIELSNIK